VLELLHLLDTNTILQYIISEYKSHLTNRFDETELDL